MSPTMTDPRPYSLQRRLLISMAVGFSVLLLIISWLLWTYARTAANRTYDLLLAGATLSVLERVTFDANAPTVDLPQTAMDILSLAPEDRIVYRIFAPEHGEITGTPDLPLPDGLTLSTEMQFYTADLSEPFRFAVQGRQMTSPTGRDWVIVQVGQTLRARNEQQMSLFLYGIGWLAGVSLLGLLFVWLAIRASLHPLRAIEGALANRSASDLSPLSGTPPHEIAGLFEAINTFIAQLARSRKLSEQFIADVAHQTRTALSALRGQLDLGQDAASDAALRDRLSRARKQTDATVHMTNQLLANAMVSHRSESNRLMPLDLRLLVRNTLADLLRERRMRDVSLSFDDQTAPEDAIRINGDEVSIREALRNLIDNAVRHGGAANTIAVRLMREDQDVVLVVSDAGPGIAPEHRAAATERFRSLDPVTAGSGLGLAIVRQVIEGHDGKMQLGTSRLGGLRIALFFPRLLALLLAFAALPSLTRAEELVIHAAADPQAMRPLIAAFLDQYPEQLPQPTITYVDYQTVDLYNDMLDDSVPVPDVVISSAMDFQVDLVNRGMARRLNLLTAILPPDWARWRSELFGFTFEPAAVLYNTNTLSAGDLPRSHRDLSSYIRDNEAALDGRIGGYDLRRSGIGYLFATQDTIQSVQAQRLMETLGRAAMRPYETTALMAEAVAKGEIVLALNVIGSYAMARNAAKPAIGVHFFDDYNLVMTRSVFVPKDAANPEMGEAFVAFLLSDDGQRTIQESTPLIAIRPPADAEATPALHASRSDTSFLPIRLGAGLLTFLDGIKREGFLRNWESTLRQTNAP
ncbi:sensor histidine kinase [Donghicola tyrosinivorans]|nr:extracellular solute-binding protein [Donghicola tyrosinivorans]